MRPGRVVRCLGAVLPLVASTVWAHAVLTKCSLVEQPVRPQTPTAVTLQFNSGIEVGFSTVVLVDAKGGEHRLDVARGHGSGQVAVTLPALAAGKYGLRYRVLATDGHVTENILRFKVTAPE